MLTIVFKIQYSLQANNKSVLIYWYYLYAYRKGKEHKVREANLKFDVHCSVVCSGFRVIA